MGKRKWESGATLVRSSGSSHVSAGVTTLADSGYISLLLARRIYSRSRYDRQHIYHCAFQGFCPVASFRRLRVSVLVSVGFERAPQLPKSSAPEPCFVLASSCRYALRRRALVAFLVLGPKIGFNAPVKFHLLRCHSVAGPEPAVTVLYNPPLEPPSVCYRILITVG